MAGEVGHHSTLACEDDEHRCFASPEVAPNQFNFHCASLESEHEELPQRGSAGRLGQQQSWLKKGEGWDCLSFERVCRGFGTGGLCSAHVLDVVLAA